MTNKRQKKKFNKFKKEVEFKVKETKSISIDKVRVVKSIHKYNNINSEKYDLKKSEMAEKVASNKDKYPKDEAILVWKTKDPEDKRRVIYNLEDGLRRYLIAKDLGLSNIQVNIIDSIDSE